MSTTLESILLANALSVRPFAKRSGVRPTPIDAPVILLSIPSVTSPTEY